MIVNVNGAELDLPDGATVQQALARLELPPRGLAVEVNLEIVPAARWPARVLAPGDRVEVVSLVGGG